MDSPERFSDPAIDRNSFLHACRNFGDVELDYIKDQIPLQRIEADKAFLEELSELPFDEKEGPYGVYHFGDKLDADYPLSSFELSLNFQALKSAEFGEVHGYTFVSADHTSLTLRKDDDEEGAQPTDTIRLIAYLLRNKSEVQVRKSRDRTREQFLVTPQDVDILKHFMRKMIHNSRLPKYLS